MLDTSFGPVVVHGDLAGFRPERPLLFMIRGAFPEPDQLVRLGETFPAADFAWSDLPGMHSPPFAWASVPLFAAAFDEALELLFPGRRITVVGISMGGTTALHMRSPLVRSMVLADPPLRTGQLWPLVGYRQIAARTPGGADWLWSILGIGPDAIEDRDYRAPLDNLTATPRFLLGGEPLMPERPLRNLPGLISAEDREMLLRRFGGAVTIIPEVGHNIVRDAEATFVRAIQSALK
jgi:pimeloyl-ACP methyl ester carboxylesterase